MSNVRLPLFIVSGAPVSLRDMTHISVPDPLRQAFSTWEGAGRPADAPTSWSLAHWSVLGDALPAGLDGLPLSRADVTAYAAKVTAEDRQAQRDLFVAAMIWGYGRVGYGPRRIRTVMDQEGFEDQLAELTRVTLEQGGPAAFQYVRDQRKTKGRCLHGLGGAFGTKYICFLTKAHPVQGISPVLDSVVRDWFTEHAPAADIHVGDGWTYPRRYGNYVEIMQAWGRELGIPADEVERLIFLQREGQTGGTWQEAWLSDRPVPGAEALLRMLEDKLGERGLGSVAEKHLRTLDELLASAADEEE